MGKWGSGEGGKWGSGEVGKWGSGEVGKGGSGEVGKWGSGEGGMGKQPFLKKGFHHMEYHCLIWEILQVCGSVKRSFDFVRDDRLTKFFLKIA